MSEARHDAATTPHPDAVIALALQALLYRRRPKKRAKMLAQVKRVADRMEAAALQSAGIYPIRAGGLAIGERPGDREALAAVTALRRATERLGGRP